MKKLLSIIALVLASASANAAILWDYSPDTTASTIKPSSSGNWGNMAGYQFFAEQIQFNTNVSVTGMDIYSGTSWGAVGDQALIRFWNDALGQPGSLFVVGFLENISVIDADGTSSQTGLNRKHVDFTNTVNLLANTPYWVGMTGNSSELAQAGLDNPNPGNGGMWYGQVGNTLSTNCTYCGDMAFRLNGTQGNVPEPATLGLLGLGLAGLGFSRRRKA